MQVSGTVRINRMEIPKETFRDWIVEDLQNLFSKFDDNRYSIFDDLEKLDQIADNIKSLVRSEK